MKFNKARPETASYPIALPLRYKITSPEMTVFGLGHTSQISSAELILHSDQSLGVGMKAEIAIAWPAMLDARVRLQLVIEGAVVRSSGDESVVEIWKYHYRTRGAWAPTEIAERIPQEVPLMPAGRLSMEPVLRAHA